jgi:hypothetical protein
MKMAIDVKSGPVAAIGLPSNTRREIILRKGEIQVRASAIEEVVASRGAPLSLKRPIALS